ncbi:hypothetical protein BDV59DRAFT_202125 [Aspergillus ambiguus]|uniref:uncharacterized protein n=1 Tax=Aspergillus ambiguus TaxID=176160 RepID=UPI003CCCEC8A
MSTDTSATAAAVPPPPEAESLAMSAVTNCVGNGDDAAPGQNEPPHPTFWRFNAPPQPLPPLPIDDIAFGPANDHRRGRTLLAPPYVHSPDSYLSHSPVRVRRGSSPSPVSPRVNVSSHHDLTCSSECKDQFVWLSPFRREAYVTAHAATDIDFRQWFPLLCTAATDSWYSFKPADIHSGGGIHALHILSSSSFARQPNARPLGLRIPQVSASAALQPRMSKLAEEEPSLVYLSVRQAINGPRRRGRYYSPGPENLPEMAGDVETGQSIYQVVRSGSREEAASQAFYHAGANRWSTIFTCVVKDTGNEPRYPLLESYMRVRSLEELIEAPSTGDKVTVFY